MRPVKRVGAVVRTCMHAAARPDESHATSRARLIRNPPKMYPFMLRLAGCMMSSVRISLAPIGTRAGTRGAVVGT